MNELVSLSYSPWSEKARWALDYRQVPYRRVPYKPMIGEPRMRMRMRRWSGTISVPVLFEGERCHPSSWEIARFAESAGQGDSLFPANEAAEIERYDTLSETGLAAGRALGLPCVLSDDEALRELVPKKLRAVLGPAARPIAAYGVRRTIRKYGAASDRPDQHQRTLNDTLAELSESLKPTEGGGPDTLLGRFSYADIAAVQVLQFVAPKSLGRFKIAPASARAYRSEALIAAYPELLSWRDDLYARYRGTEAS